MTVVTVYAADDGYCIGNDATTYLTARSTATTAYDAAGVQVGQAFGGGGYTCAEGFLFFDISAVLPTSRRDTAISMFAKVQSDASGVDFDLKVQAKTWQAAVTTADWVAGASLSATTYFTANTADAVTDAFLEFTFEGSYPAVWTTEEYLVYSSRHKAGDVPTGLESIMFYPVSTAGTTSDPYMVFEYYSVDPVAGYLDGALGPACLYDRELSAAEVAEVMAQGMSIIERSLDSGTVVIAGNVKTRSGAVVPAKHVRAGWWIHNIDASDDPLLITAHSVDLAAGKNALTIGVDWMEEETGAKLADLLAIPATAPPELPADLDPYMPDATDNPTVAEDHYAIAAASDPRGRDPYGEGANAPYDPLVDDPNYYNSHPWMAPRGWWDTHGAEGDLSGQTATSVGTPATTPSEPADPSDAEDESQWDTW